MVKSYHKGYKHKNNELKYCFNLQQNTNEKESQTNGKIPHQIGHPTVSKVHFKPQPSRQFYACGKAHAFKGYSLIMYNVSLFVRGKS